MINLCNWLGRIILDFLETTGRTVQLLLQTVIQLRRINFRHVIYQMAHLGVDTMPIIFMMISSIFFIRLFLRIVENIKDNKIFKAK